MRFANSSKKLSQPERNAPIEVRYQTNIYEICLAIFFILRDDVLSKGNVPKFLKRRNEVIYSTLNELLLSAIFIYCVPVTVRDVFKHSMQNGERITLWMIAVISSLTTRHHFIWYSICYGIFLFRWCNYLNTSHRFVMSLSINELKTMMIKFLTNQKYHNI